MEGIKMKALIIVDMQNDFIDGALGTPEAQAIVPNVVNKMKEHQYTDTIILFTKDTHYEWYLETSEGKKLPVPHCIKDTLGWSIAKPIASEFRAPGYMTYSSETVINGRVLKQTFGSYDLLNILNDIDPDEIELCGVCTDICVISNAIMIKNCFPDVKVTVDASCCAGVTPEKHAAALDVMKSCQIDVIGE
jgi:nicotinamidase-related amidase